MTKSFGLGTLPGEALVSPLPLSRNLPIELRLRAVKLLLGFCDRLGFLRGRFPSAARIVALPLSPLKLAARATRARCACGGLLVTSGFTVEPNGACLFRRLLLTMTFQLLLAAPDLLWAMLTDIAIEVTRVACGCSRWSRISRSDGALGLERPYHCVVQQAVRGERRAARLVRPAVQA